MNTQMNKIILVLGVCMVISFAGCKSGNIKTSNPNIILFYVDDMGYGDLGCFGNDDIHTPRIDQMAEQGIRFTNFYNSASGCIPSRAALLTGRYHMRCGVNFIPPPTDSVGMSGSEITIAEMLKEAGYTTAAFGKWHLGTPMDCLPKNQGFDYFYGSTSAHTYFLPANYNAEDELLAPVFESTPDLNTTQVGTIPTRDRTTLLTDKLIKFIHSNNSTDNSKPFFTYVPYPMPHTPISAPLECRAKLSLNEVCMLM